jgi:GR25 family glycosyltransferase involved in LPS biosynthesis
MLNFDKIYLISLTKKRPNKVSEFMNRLPKDWNLGQIDIMDAIDGYEMELPVWWNSHLKGSYGCLRSHCKILEYIMKNNLLNVMIFEDDAIFSDNFIMKLQQICENLPTDWEQLYLGGQHLAKPRSINNDIVKGVNINRTHCYVIKDESVAKKILSNLNSKDFWIKYLNKHKYHIDYAYGAMHKHNMLNSYACNPFIVGQAENTFSDTGSQISKVDRWWN